MGVFFCCACATGSPPFVSISPTCTRISRGFRVVVRSVLEGGRVSVILDGLVAHAQPEVGFSSGFNAFFAMCQLSLLFGVSQVVFALQLGRYRKGKGVRHFGVLVAHAQPEVGFPAVLMHFSGIFRCYLVCSPNCCCWFGYIS